MTYTEQATRSKHHFATPNNKMMEKVKQKDHKATPKIKQNKQTNKP